MINRQRRQYLAGWGRLALVGIAAAILLSGCGGGGGGSSSGSGGGTSTNTVTVTGTLQDSSTGILLQNRTVTVSGTSLTGTSNSAGVFSIASVPVTTIILTVTDSNGASDGSSSAINLAKLSGNPRNVGTVSLDVTGSSPPPPPLAKPAN